MAHRRLVWASAPICNGAAALHRVEFYRPCLVRFVADEGDDHAVEVKEEHEQVETQLDERFLRYVSIF